MTDHRDYVSDNNRSLKRLSRTIELSQGRFSLLLVRCNQVELQAEIRQRLSLSHSCIIQDLVLPPATKTLYAAIKTVLNQESFSVLMVFGLESVVDLDGLLVAANQVRDSFKKSFAFPIVLWVTNDVLKKLMRLAPDFHSWAGIPIHFAISTDVLKQLLKHETDTLFTAALEVGAGRLLRSSALYSQIGANACKQLKTALKELRDRDEEPDPALAASLEFALGLDAYTNRDMDVARQHYEQSLTFWQQEATEQRDADGIYLKRQACVLYYLGLWWRRQAVLHRAEELTAWRQASNYYRQCVEVLQPAHPDLAAKFINSLGEVLGRLGKHDSVWTELEVVAKTAVELNQTYFDPLRLAYSYGLLAEVALAAAKNAEAKSEGSEANVARHQAKQFAQRALDINDQLIGVTPEAQKQYAELGWAQKHYRSLYRLLLAQAQRYLDSLDEALKTLEIAKTECKQAYDPILYTRILRELREVYFQQGKYNKPESYLTAFKIKQEQRSIEQQFGLRAFIGAVRLQPERQVINPGLILIEPSDDYRANADTDELLAQSGSVAQEIAASGRQHDVEELIKRLSLPRYNLTIIHGQSGVGKSSILSAGLVPALRREPIGDRQVLPVVLRIYKDWKREIGVRFADALDLLDIEISDEALTKLRAITEIQMLTEQLQANDRQGLLTVLIFDQFEEFFFAHPNPRDRKPFLKFLSECFNLYSVKVVLSLREDYLHHLLELGRLAPDDITKDILGQEKRYPLGNFRRSDAELIIERLTQRSQFHLDKDLIEQLVEDLAEETDEVRPIELQIVGSQLQELEITSKAEYQKLGLDNNKTPKEKLVENSLEQVIEDCGPENRKAAITVLHLLTDERGTRPIKTLSELTVNLKEWDLPANLKQLELVLEILVMSGLVLELLELSISRYQLVHDYLALLVQQKLKQEVDQLIDEKKQKQFEEAAKKREWEAREQGRKQQQRILIFSGVVASLGIPAIVLAFFAYNQMNRAAIAEVEANTALASGLFQANDQLEALTNSLRAGVQLQNQRKRPDAFLLQLERSKAKTLGNLFETIYSIRERNRLLGHRSWVNGVSVDSVDPKTQLLASASADNTIKLWRDGNLVRTLEGHRNRVNGVSFSPDGQQLASASDDKTIKLWNVNGIIQKTLTRHTGYVTSVSFSRDGQWLVSSSDDGSIGLWNRRNGKLIKFIEKQHRDRIKAVSFSPKGQMFASASWDGTVKLWKPDGTLIRTLGSLGDARLTSVSFSPDGQTVASGSWDNTVKLWKVDGELLPVLKGHTDRVMSVSFSPDGEKIVSTSNDGSFKLWNNHNGLELRTIKTPGVISASFIDNNTVVSTGDDNAIKYWQLNGISPATVLHNTEVVSIDFSLNGKWIASASKTSEIFSEVSTTKSAEGKGKLVEGQIKLGQPGSINHSEGVIFPALGNFTSIKFSPNSEILASAENPSSVSSPSQPRVKLWDLKGNQLDELTMDGQIAGIGFSPDGKTVVIAANTPPSGSTKKATQGVVHLWNSQSKKRTSFVAHNDKINGISVSRSGMIATASLDSTVKLWTQTGELSKTLNHTGLVKSVVFSPDGKVIATASAGTTIKLWDLVNEQLTESKELISSSTASTTINGLSFSYDGNLLLSASDSGTLSIWNAESGELLANLQGSQNQINAVSFSPVDSKVIASAGNDNAVSLWQFDLEALLKMGCGWLDLYRSTNQRSQDICKQVPSN